MTNARNKLNAAAVNGVLIVAGFVGLATESWRVFCVVALVLVISAALAGDIRGKGGRRR